MICTKCGNKVAEDAVFCTKCGRKIERMQCPHCGKTVDKNAVFCSECGKRITENLSVQEEAVENVAVEAEEQAEEITAKDNAEKAVPSAEEVREMNLFEKIEEYQRQGLEHVAEYVQFLEVKNLTYFFWKLRYFIGACIFSLWLYSFPIFSTKSESLAGAVFVYFIGILILIVYWLNGIIVKLLVVDSEENKRYIAKIFWEEHKSTCKICCIFCGIGFILVALKILIWGGGWHDMFFLFGCVLMFVSAVWTFRSAGGVVLLALMLIMGVFSDFALTAQNELMDKMQCYEQAYESELVMDMSYPELSKIVYENMILM